MCVRPAHILAHCPWCGTPLPHDPAPYTLDRDQELVIFCPRCGAEIALHGEVDDA